VDLVTSCEGVKVLGLVQVPEHGGTVLATRCAERSIGRDGNGVDVAGVADVIGLDLAGCELPNLRSKLASAHENFVFWLSKNTESPNLHQCNGVGWSHSLKALK